MEEGVGGVDVGDEMEGGGGGVEKKDLVPTD